MVKLSMFKKQEFYVFCLLVLLVTFISLINPLFLSAGNIFSILKSSIIIGILSIGVLLVLLSGGIDVSFPVFAAFSLYTSSLFFTKFFPESPIVFIYLFAMTIGGLCGLLNGILIAFYRFPALVVTLGTSSALAGFMFSFIGTKINHDIPNSMVEFGKSLLFVQKSTSGEIIGLPTAIFIFVILAILAFLFLRFSMIGRFIYSIGGDEISAERVGINVKKIKIFVYVLVGILSSIAGITQSSFLRIASPFELYGVELTVIAAAVLGGAYIGGGKGTVTGTILGVFLITIINNSLIIVGIPSYWQKVVVGIIILFAVSLPIFIKKSIHKRSL